MADLENIHKEEHKADLEQGYETGHRRNVGDSSLSRNLDSPGSNSLFMGALLLSQL